MMQTIRTAAIAKLVRAQAKATGQEYSVLSARVWKIVARAEKETHARGVR